MTEKKTTLPSLWDYDGEKIKVETEKINKFLRNISADNITKLNELIYAEAILAYDKIDVLQRNPNRNINPGREIRPEQQGKKLRQQAKMLWTEKRYVGRKR